MVYVLVLGGHALVSPRPYTSFMAVRPRAGGMRPYRT